MKPFKILGFFLLFLGNINAQNYTFNFDVTGQRVCLLSSEVSISNKEVKILFLDSLSNTSRQSDVYRRRYGSTEWTLVASSLIAGTGHWIDNNVNEGEIWEYQVKRSKTWNYEGVKYDAIGYTMACMMHDNTNYKGQLILLVANDIPINTPAKYNRLKKELTSDGWFVNEIIVPKSTNWDSGNEVVTIKTKIVNVYSGAPSNDKPKALFILGQVPLPRSGASSVVAPDDHVENKGARGCDAYYADIDGVYTDTATYNPGGLVTPLAINLPGDFKWDQDFFPSDIEMAFGRIDFADISDVALTELQMIENYLDRLSNYKNVATGFEMGNKSGFFFGYDNSNDGSYRSLLNISKPKDVYQNYTGPNHNQWVKNNGPFSIYMQNLVVPSLSDWTTYGMDATVYSSDQSYWGFGDVPQPAGVYSRIRSLLGIESKCLVTLWTTTGINIFHQACSGEPLGISMKTIMNHNSINNYLEKPQQEYDAKNWWNRTHFAFYGDPTINLYQVHPPKDITLTSVNNKAQLSWLSSSDAIILGYQVYESTSEFGVYNKISTSIVTDSKFIIDNYINGNWYMVKAVKVIESGCGQFLHSSMGIDLQSNLVISETEDELSGGISIYPNPTSNFINVLCDTEIKVYKVMDAKGKVVIEKSINSIDFIIDLSPLSSGIYIIKLVKQNGDYIARKLVKSE